MPIDGQCKVGAVPETVLPLSSKISTHLINLDFNTIRAASVTSTSSSRCDTGRRQSRTVGSAIAESDFSWPRGVNKLVNEHEQRASKREAIEHSAPGPVSACMCVSG